MVSVTMVNSSWMVGPGVLPSLTTYFRLRTERKGFKSTHDEWCLVFGTVAQIGVSLPQSGQQPGLISRAKRDFSEPVDYSQRHSGE